MSIFDKIVGTYRFDPKNTARLVAGFFHERFEMQPGYDEALQDTMEEEDEETAELRLVLTDQALHLKSEDEEEVFDILRTWQEEDRQLLEVQWHDHPEQFEIQRLGEGSIRLFNEANELSQFAWSHTD